MKERLRRASTKVPPHRSPHLEPTISRGRSRTYLADAHATRGTVPRAPRARPWSSGSTAASADALQRALGGDAAQAEAVSARLETLGRDRSIPQRRRHAARRRSTGRRSSPRTPTRPGSSRPSSTPSSTWRSAATSSSGRSLRAPKTARRRAGRADPRPGAPRCGKPESALPRRRRSGFRRPGVSISVSGVPRRGSRNPETSRAATRQRAGVAAHSTAARPVRQWSDAATFGEAVARSSRELSTVRAESKMSDGVATSGCDIQLPPVLLVTGATH